MRIARGVSRRTVSYITRRHEWEISLLFLVAVVVVVDVDV